MHLPFCQRLCLFCGCNVVISRHRAVVAPYVEHLKREVDAIVSRIARERSVVQFHWGGGAPTYLSPAELEDLFLHVRSRFRFSHDAEVSVENGLTPPASVQ
jgi:oxygen-independent coproporphyrinogen-3 oxidase